MTQEDKKFLETLRKVVAEGHISSYEQLWELEYYEEMERKELLEAEALLKDSTKDKPQTQRSESL